MKREKSHARRGATKTNDSVSTDRHAIHEVPIRQLETFVGRYRITATGTCSLDELKAGIRNFSKLASWLEARRAAAGGTGAVDQAMEEVAEMPVTYLKGGEPMPGWATHRRVRIVGERQ